MGQFSWFTCDYKERILVGVSRNIKMAGKDGRVFIQKDTYKGYGEFGGKDFYAYLAELSVPEQVTGNKEHDRLIGIDLTFKNNPSGDLKKNEERGILVSPRLFTGNVPPDVMKFDPPVPDPDQGFEDDGFTFEANKTTVKVQEEFKIPGTDVIVEVGDRLEIVENKVKELKESSGDFSIQIMSPTEIYIYDVNSSVDDNPAFIVTFYQPLFKEGFTLYDKMDRIEYGKNYSCSYSNSLAQGSVEAVFNTANELFLTFNIDGEQIVHSFTNTDVRAEAVVELNVTS